MLWLRARFRALRRSKTTAMNARAVNVAILLLLTFELATGLGSFLVGNPGGRWLFLLHRVGGLALVVLLAWKVGIAARSYRRRGVTTGTALSAVAGILFLGSLVTGGSGPPWGCRGFRCRCWEAGPS